MTSASHRNDGFTLIELMITIAIVAIVVTIGVPSFTDFIASQRVRTAASDLIADMAFARAEAIKESRRAIMERLAGATGTWKDGWRICVDIDGDGACGAAEIRKASTPIAGRSRVCNTTADYVNSIVFRPDGRVVRGAGAVLASDGIKVSDDIGDADTTNDRVRLVYIGVTGRAGVEIQDNNPSNPARGTACP